MPVLYATNEFDIRRQAMADALSRYSESAGRIDESIDDILARADKILAWYLRDATTQEIAP